MTLPYPAELEHTITLRDGTRVFVRPIRPEDADGITRQFARLSAEDVRRRFLAPMKTPPPRLLWRMTHIDYDREMALAAFADAARADPVAIVRLAAEPDRARAEYAIIVGPDMKGRGLGRALMTEIIEHARRSGIGEVYGTILADNRPMIALARTLGFTIAVDPDDASLVIARLALGGAAAGGASAPADG